MAYGSTYLVSDKSRLAIQDGSGNIITSTYLKLSGGTITGTLTINSTLTQAENQIFSAGGSIEMHPSASANHGGFIDFHCNNEDTDYTERIIGYNGNITMLSKTDTSMSLQIKSPRSSGYAELRADSEGGNLRLINSDNTIYYEADVNSGNFRIYSYNDCSAATGLAYLLWNRLEGSLTLKGGNNSNYATTISTEENKGILNYHDTTGTQRFRIYSNKTTDGTYRTFIMTGNTTNGYNQIAIGIKTDGTRIYSVTDPAAFRNAIGASSGVWPVSLGGTGATTAANARTNLGTIAKTGDTMSGGLTVSLAKGTENHFIARASGYTNSANLDVSLEVGDGKQNHGVYSTGYSTDGNAFTSDGKWLIYRNSSGTVIVNGNCTGSSSTVSYTESSLKFSSTTFNISSNWEKNMCWLGDSTGSGIGRINFVAQTDGTTKMGVLVRAWNTSSSAIGSFLGITMVGTRSNTVTYSISNNANFRNALGASSGTWPVSIGGTGTATAPTKGGVIYAYSTSAYSSTAAGTTGQYLKSNGASGPTWENMPSGTTISANTGKIFLTGYSSATKSAGLTYTLLTNTNVYISGTTGYLYAARVYNAVWNDIAEYRQTDNIEAGRVYQENDNGIMTKTQERLIPGCSIASDTFGTAMGETVEALTPMAIAGRVLVYPYQNRDHYHAGMAVCSAPNGTVDIMTREEIMMYPDSIIGIVSEIPEYEIWGTGKIEVDGRIWIKIK